MSALRETIMTAFVTTHVLELIVHKQTNLLTNHVRYLVLLKTDYSGGTSFNEPQLVWMPARADLVHFIDTFEDINRDNQTTLA